MRLAQIWPLIKDSVTAWIDDYAPSMGAALAYYTVFSVTPLLLIVIAVAGFAFGHDAVRGEIVNQLGGLLGEEGATAVQGLLKSADEPSKGIWASIIGVALLIVGATTVFAELQSALDRIWRVPAAKKRAACGICFVPGFFRSASCSGWASSCWSRSSLARHLARLANGMAVCSAAGRSC